MKIIFCLVLAVMIFSLTDASAAGNSEPGLSAPAQNFSRDFQFFYDLAAERRGMMPLALVDENGKPVSLDDYKGKFIVLHFWATWCPPCIRELPTLEKFRLQRKKDNLAVLAVSLDYGAEKDKIKFFMKRMGLDTPVLQVARNDSSWSQLSGFILPETFIISPKGQVLYKMVGDANWTDDAAASFFDALLKPQKK